jgi:prevent-host-death family protein
MAESDVGRNAGMAYLTTTEAQNKLPALLRRVGRGDRFLLHNSRGKVVGAIVPAEDLELLERHEASRIEPDAALEEKTNRKPRP